MTFAAAYLKVINAYHLLAIDIDIEHTEMANHTSRQKVVDALGIVRRQNPDLWISMTIGTNQDGPDAKGLSLISDAANAGLWINAWTVMPFDFVAPISDMGKVSIQAAEGLKRDLMQAYHTSAAVTYRTMGISSMNGHTDETDETVTKADFMQMLRYVDQHHLARFTFWATNRDRPCDAVNHDSSSCSGINQQPYEFTRMIAAYQYAS